VTDLAPSPTAAADADRRPRSLSRPSADPIVRELLPVDRTAAAELPAPFAEDPTDRPGRNDRAARAILFGVLERTIGGRVTIEVGRDRRVFGSSRPDRFGRTPLEATVRIHDPRTYGRVATNGSVGLGESYADGWWDVDDLPALLRILERNVRRADPVRQKLRRLTAPITDPVRRLRREDRRRDREDIQAHYDLGNDFFERLLDETMMYSSAIFPSATSTLAEGSVHKLDRICQRIRLGPDDHVLEIGTGWGGFAVHAAQHYGCRVTTTTISDRQFEYARERVAAAGLQDRVQVLDLDYRDLEGSYDAIVSIEMIEAVDWREYDTFFRACSRLLGPDGRMAMQAITIPGQRFEQAKARKDFIRQIIFPGGCLPSVEALLASSSRVSDLSLVELDDIGRHYAETLRRWGLHLHAYWNDLPRLGLDDRFGRLWDFYLAYCEAGFDERDISAVQIVLAQPGWGVSGIGE
jgi:cyclopropane-fatty-acyl-phospholipid synthase